MPRKGSSIPKELKERISQTCKKNGIGLWMTGRKQSAELIEKRVKNTRGENHWQIKLRGIMPSCKNCNHKLSSRYTKHGLCHPCWAKTNSGESQLNYKGGYENKLWHNRQRRAKRLEVGGSHTLAQWEELKMQCQYMCLCCKKTEPEITLTADHIIPIIKGGSSDISNIQPLCGPCNSRKKDRVIYYQVLGKEIVEE